jgi:diaminohydroxyphosphoribosylaminopyrimidine deaminase/5-amino-6-(5-phosphoribosylamino)uracil reductase
MMPSWVQSLKRAEKEGWMLEAVKLAKRGKGLTAPNPCVGALILHQGQLAACGWHRRYGSAHAEVEAIESARAKGIDLSQAALWVTLEPCNHFGKTPPCTQAILEAGIAAVFIGLEDPNPDVAGGGAELLRSKGLHVETDLAPVACRDLIADFLLWQQQKRPFVILKLASTLDGKIGTRQGRPLRISGEQARAAVQKMRSRVGAVLVGGKTFRQDDPRLTCRLPDRDTQDQPLAVVITSQLTESCADRYLISQRPDEVVIWTDERTAQSPEAARLAGRGVRIWPLGPEPGCLDLAAGLRRLFAEEACYYLLCEGGGELASSLAEAGLVDELNLFLAPTVLGDEAAASTFSGRRVDSLQEALSWRLVESRPAAEDVWLIFHPAEKGLTAREGDIFFDAPDGSIGSAK